MVASSGIVIGNSLRLRQPFEMPWLRNRGRRCGCSAASPVRNHSSCRSRSRDDRAAADLPRGLLGSAHCVGMCGGFALTIGVGARASGPTCVRQLALHARPGPHLLVLRRGGRLRRLLALAEGGGAGERPGRPVDPRGQPALSRAAGPRPLALAAPPAAGGGAPPAWPARSSGRSSAPGWSNILLAGVLTAFCPAAWSTVSWAWPAVRPASSRAPDDGRLRGRHRADHDPDRRRGLAPVALGPAAPAASRGGLRVMITGLISLARGVMFVQFPGSASRSSPARSAGRTGRECRPRESILRRIAP